MSNALDALSTIDAERLAELLGTKPWRIYEMVKKGTAPPHFRVGKVLRFRVADVAKWMGEQVAGSKED